MSCVCVGQLGVWPSHSCVVSVTEWPSSSFIIVVVAIVFQCSWGRGRKILRWTSPSSSSLPVLPLFFRPSCRPRGRGEGSSPHGMEPPYCTANMVDSNVNRTSPDVAPPRHVPVSVPVGHLSLAARTHSSQRFLVTLMVAPSVVAVKVNLALPRLPMVVEVPVRQRVLSLPEMPSQMASWAAFCSW